MEYNICPMIILKPKKKQTKNKTPLGTRHNFVPAWSWSDRVWLPGWQSAASQCPPLWWRSWPSSAEHQVQFLAPSRSTLPSATGCWPGPWGPAGFERQRAKGNSVRFPLVFSSQTNANRSWKQTTEWSVIPWCCRRAWPCVWWSHCVGWAEFAAASWWPPHSRPPPSLQRRYSRCSHQI